MDGTARCILALLCVALLAPGCSSWKSKQAPTVKMPEQKLLPPLVLRKSQNLDIQFALGRTFEQDKDLDQAASLYRQILEKDDEHAGATHRLAIVYDQQGLYEESEQLFRRALELQPGNADLYCDMGYSFYCQQKWQQAQMNFRQAIAVAPNHKRAHNQLGLALAASGNSDEALQEFHKAGCSLAEARMNLALLQTFDGRLEEARANYELARRADPGKENLALRLQGVESMLAKGVKSAVPSDTQLAQEKFAASPQNSEVSPVSFERGQQQPQAASGDELETEETSPATVESRWKRLMKW